MEAAVTNVSFREALVIENDVLLGWLPYASVRNRWGLVWGGVSFWGHLAGPVLRPGLCEQRQAEVLDCLLSQLSNNVRWKFVCRPDASLAPVIKAAFSRAGFEEFRANTYLFPADDPGVLSRFSKKHRTHIRAADKRLDVIDIDAKAFIDFYSDNLLATKRKSYEPLAVAERIAQAGLALDEPRIRILAARRRTKDGVAEKMNDAMPLDAAVALVWDQKCCYLWMLTYRAASPVICDKPHPDAVKLLIVKAAEHARALGLVFDLDGVANAGSDEFYRNVIKAPFLVDRLVSRRQRRVQNLSGDLVRLKHFADAFLRRLT